ncbi:hypothetical protein [Candidatus Nitronereus thalassa]|uniref:PE-PGRS family protein n=1 Tax=Candidatus Nitronereus thalassa TaxID=3020898 RepID=A0ABU3K3D2_9BACT|nr:hypothetical protein [Candidatus Nitronereus thalassa]MDT7040883.1 hypothetical protein [Candidatus Nitronereus thalassa]
MGTIVWPSANDVGVVAGAGVKLWERRLCEQVRTLLDRDFIVSGFTLPSSDADLTIDVAAGLAHIDGHIVDIDTATAVVCTASQTNHIFLKLTKDMAGNVLTAEFEVNTTGTAPADSVKIGTATTSGSAVTSTVDLRVLSPFGLSSTPRATGAGSTQAHEGTVVISSNTNLSGVHFYNNLTVNAGVTITVPAGGLRLVLIASESITLNGKINAKGAGGAGGAPSTTNGNPGQPGTDQAGGGGGGGHLQGQAGNGGASICHNFTKRAGGAGGGVSTDGTAATSLTGSQALVGFDPFFLFGGAGGGGGGASSGSACAGGGNGGGSVVLIAPSIIFGASSEIDSSGNNGPNGGTASTNSGGGGGGGAGNIYIIAKAIADSGMTFTMNGGAGGAEGSPSPGNGAAGANGFRQINIS